VQKENGKESFPVAELQRLIPRSLTPRQKDEAPEGDAEEASAAPEGASVEEGIRARVKDPLWFLARQWQLGEFTAENCGSIARVDLETAMSPIESIDAGAEAGPVQTAPGLPLEPYVEADGSQVEGDDIRLMPSRAWKAENLEYQFSIQAEGGATVLKAREYYGEHLDWYNFSLEQWTPSTSARSSRVFAVPVAFPGMPKPRWWQYEDHRVDLGDIQRPNLNFLSALFIEFAVLYSNDWFLIPAQQPENSLRQVTGLKVTNVFGDPATTIPAHSCSANPDQGTESFTLFTYPYDDRLDSSVLFLPNTLSQHAQSEPLEEVIFFRDEMANLVWAVEKAYFENGRIKNRDTEPVEPLGVLPGPALLPLYRVMSPVPPHWIPYIPIQFSSASGQVYFRRARTKVLPAGEKQYRSRLLADSWKVMEEEIPSTPIVLTQNVKMATYERSDGSRVRWIWAARRKNQGIRLTGSGLKFDYIVESGELAGSGVICRDCRARLLAVDNGGFYWVDPSSTVLFRGRILNDRLVCEDDQDEGCTARLLAVDHGILYWVDPDSTILYRGSIDRDKLRCDYGQDDGCTARLLAVDHDTLYWVDPDSTILYWGRIANDRLVCNGNLDENCTARLLAVDNGILYWTEEGSTTLYRGRVVNGRLLRESAIDRNFTARLFAVDGGILYRVNQGSTTLHRSRLY
jgi:hypothetical protein